MSLTLTIKDLREIVQSRGAQSVTKLRQHGGIDDLCTGLNTSPAIGLSETNIESMSKTYGVNIIPTIPPKSFLRLFWDALNDTTLILLMIAATISLLISLLYKPAQSVSEFEEDEAQHSWIEGAFLFMSVFTIVLVSACTDYSREKRFRNLQEFIKYEQVVNVIRDGQMQEISVIDIVVGDICVVKYGDIIPADGVLIQAHDLMVDESSLTGEPVYVAKCAEKDVILLSSSQVMEGSGKMVVVAVGARSEVGIMYTLLQRMSDNTRDGEDDEFIQSFDSQKLTKSLLLNKIANLTVRFGIFGAMIAVIMALLLIGQFTYTHLVRDGNALDMRYFEVVLDHVVISVAILVVAIPEGLPLAVTLALAFSVKRMIKDNNLVRHLESCETMGNCTTICSDKTGTLTQNDMTVVRSFICDKVRGQVTENDIPAKVCEIIAQVASLNSSNTTKIEWQGARFKQFGNRTECALLAFLAELGVNYEEVRAHFGNDDIVKIYTFNSFRKFMGTIVRLSNNRGYRCLVKGAVEILIYKCQWYFYGDANVASMDDSKRRAILDIVNTMSNDGLRTLCVTYRDFVFESSDVNDSVIVSEPEWDVERTVSKMTFLALFGIEDPVRDEVPEAIRICRKAGE